MIKYYKLLDMMNRNDIKRTELLKIMSSGTLAKLAKGDIIKTDIIDRICTFFECQPGDIMEHIISQTEFEENKKTIIENKHAKRYSEEINEETIEIEEEYKTKREKGTGYKYITNQEKEEKKFLKKLFEDDKM